MVHKEEELYVALCPEVGTISQGETIEKAVLNLKEATELYLEEAAEDGTLVIQEAAPLVTTFEAKVA